MKHSILDKIIPRVVATGALAYLLYSLIWRGEDFSYLHVATFALIVALVLVPFARRLKIPTLIDFESKLESLREETRKELVNIRNQISTTIESRIIPIQHQWTVFGMGEPAMKQFVQSISEEFRRTTSIETGKGDKYTRSQFLRKADSYLARSLDALFLAHSMQLAIYGQQPPKKSPNHVRSADERINDWVNFLLKEGVHFFVPPEHVEETVEGLKAIKNLLEIRKKVDSEEEEPPDPKETEELFAKAKNTIEGILSGATLQGWYAVLYRNDMIQKLKELRESLNTEDSPSKQ